MDLHAMVEKIEMSDDRAVRLVDSYRKKSGYSSTKCQGARDWIARRIIRRYARKCASVGGASALPGVVPGAGTAVAIAAAAPDIAACMKLQVDMCKCLAIVYGYDISQEDDRYLYQMIAATGSLNRAVRNPAINLGTKAGVQMLRKHLRGAALQAVKETFKRVGITFTRKATEKALPFGIGVGIAGTSNYLMTLFVGRQAKKFFEKDTTS